jgi:hypothetical protein
VKKKILKSFFLLLCVAIFLTFRIYGLSKQRSPLRFSVEKPILPVSEVQISEEKPECFLIKRIYLGETKLGMPFHLDVRQFGLKQHSADDLIDWHLNILKGSTEEIYLSDKRKIYLCRGIRNPDRPDTTHGFASIQGERALFLDFYLNDDCLYVCSAEAPLETFEEHESFLRSLAEK